MIKSRSSTWDRLQPGDAEKKVLGEIFQSAPLSSPPQYSSLMFKGREEGDTSPLLPLLLVTMATLLPPLPWRPPPPPPPLLVGGVVVEEAGCWSFFLLILRSLARRFWNQIFTCRREEEQFLDELGQV